MVASRIGLVADIGRHAVRFALTGGAEGVEPRDVRTFNTAEHTTFTSALLSFVGDLGLDDQPLPGVLAIAGMTRGNLINVTGSRWYISLSGVEAVLRERPIALNEAAASAMALTVMSSGAMIPLGPLPARAVEVGGNYLLVSIGTGCGCAALVTTPGRRLAPVQSEAGHVSFSAQTADEHRFALELASRGPLSAEALLSADGLLAAHTMLSPGGRPPASAQDVTKGFGRDPVCDAVGRLVAGYLAGFVGDLVLAYGAWDGVFITGAVGRALHRQMMLPAFRQRFEAKDAHRRQLAQVPISLIARTDLELLGAAATFASD